MSFQVPEIRFQYGWLLTRAFYQYRKMLTEYKDEEPPAWNVVNEIVENRRKIWEPVEQKIITGMQEIAGLNFYQNIIDVYIVTGYSSAFSEPLVMSKKYEGDVFVDILTHEIIHRLLMDNKEGINGNSWAAEHYPEEKDSSVVNHILVHALHKEVYLSVLGSPERLMADKDRLKGFHGYEKAWDIVERDGHINIINKFKESIV